MFTRTILAHEYDPRLALLYGSARGATAGGLPYEPIFKGRRELWFDVLHELTVPAWLLGWRWSRHGSP